MIFRSIFLISTMVAALAGYSQSVLSAEYPEEKKRELSHQNHNDNKKKLTVNLDSLPKEIVLKIFYYLPKNICNLMPINEGFRKIVYGEILSLRAIKLNKNDIKPWIRFLYELPNINTLDLKYRMIGPEDTECLSNYLKLNSTLTTLDLGSNQIDDQGAKDLSEALHINSTLTKLNLPCNQIGDQGAKDLSEALHINSTLTKLNLDSNRIGDEGARFIRQRLDKNSTLTTLDLGRNGIGDEEDKLIKSFLLRNKKLTNYRSTGLEEQAI